MTSDRAFALLRRALLISAIALAVSGNVLGLMTLVVDHERAFDWEIYAEAGQRFGLGTLYDWEFPYYYRYAPQLAPVLGLLTSFGLQAWWVAEFVAVAVLPSRRLALLLLVSYPFWFGVVTGNLMVFVLLAAAWAYRGNGVATGTYLALCLLVPRPIMLPLLAWILWQRPAWRLPFAAMVAALILTALPTGYLPVWLGSLFESGASEIANDFNLSPSQFIGAAWLVIGVPLAVWLTVRGRVGWASMTISPYLLPYWIQMLGLELVKPGPGSGAQQVSMWTRIRR